MYNRELLYCRRDKCIYLSMPSIYYRALAEETRGKSLFPHAAKAGAAVNSIRLPLADQHLRLVAQKKDRNDGSRK